MQNNDKKVINFTTIVHERKEIPKLECVKGKNSLFVKYGNNNDFPDYVFELYNNSSQMSAIIDTMLRYIEGNGIISNYPLKIVNRKFETFNNLIEKLVLDYLLYGGFSMQITRNKLGEIAELNYVDMRYVRVNEDEDKIFYSEEWDKGRRTPKVYDRYTPNSKFPTSILYYKGRKTRNVYPVPIYLSALTSLEISTQIPEYHINCLENGFLPGGIINFNAGSSLPEDVMEEIEDRIKEKFTGTRNASKILLSFNDSTEHSTTFERLADDGNIDVYANLANSVEKDIYTAFRISKLLLGNAEDNTGFSKQAYIESFALYQKTVIQPIQSELEEVINGVLGEGALHFDEFTIDWSETGADENTSDIIK